MNIITNINVAKKAIVKQTMNFENKICFDDFSQKMRLEICYPRRCITSLYDLISVCKQPFEI